MTTTRRLETDNNDEQKHTKHGKNTENLFFIFNFLLYIYFPFHFFFISTEFLSFPCCVVNNHGNLYLSRDTLFAMVVLVRGGEPSEFYRLGPYASPGNNAGSKFSVSVGKFFRIKTRFSLTVSLNSTLIRAHF